MVGLWPKERQSSYGLAIIGIIHQHLRFVFVGVQAKYFLVLVVIIIRSVCLKFSLTEASCQEDEWKGFLEAREKKRSWLCDTVGLAVKLQFSGRCRHDDGNNNETTIGRVRRAANPVASHCSLNWQRPLYILLIYWATFCAHWLTAKVSSSLILNSLASAGIQLDRT